MNLTYRLFFNVLITLWSILDNVPLLTKDLNICFFNEILFWSVSNITSWRSSVFIRLFSFLSKYLTLSKWRLIHFFKNGEALRNYFSGHRVTNHSLVLSQICVCSIENNVSLELIELRRAFSRTSFLDMVNSGPRSNVFWASCFFILVHSKRWPKVILTWGARLWSLRI